MQSIQLNLLWVNLNFPLEPVEKNKFRFESAGITAEFFPEKKEFILKQGGGAYTFSKIP